MFSAWRLFTRLMGACRRQWVRGGGHPGLHLGWAPSKSDWNKCYYHTPPLMSILFKKHNKTNKQTLDSFQTSTTNLVWFDSWIIQNRKISFILSETTTKIGGAICWQPSGKWPPSRAFKWLMGLFQKENLKLMIQFWCLDPLVIYFRVLLSCLVHYWKNTFKSSTI